MKSTQKTEMKKTPPKLTEKMKALLPPTHKISSEQAKNIKEKAAKKTVEDKVEAKFDLNEFINEKLGNLQKKNEKQKIFDSKNSSLADMIKFNTILAHSFYKITDRDLLEVVILALHPEVEVDSIGNPAVKTVIEEVALFKDLLLLGDLSTITQEKKHFEWILNAPNLSKPAMVAIMTSFITLVMKMTGNKSARFNQRMPAGNLVGKKREEVMSYMIIMQTIVNAMSRGNSWKKIEKMEVDLNKIITEFRRPLLVQMAI